jgi:hypothetical protein
MEGSGWTHMLLWMVSDLAWLQCWLYASLFFACIGGSLSVLCFVRYVKLRKIASAFSEAAVTLWLFANTFVMYGECHDVYYNTNALNPNAALSDQAETKARFIFWAACILFLTLCVVRFARGRFGFERFSKAANDTIRLQTIVNHHPYESNNWVNQQGSESRRTEAPKAAATKCVLHKLGFFSHVIRMIASSSHATHF